MKKILTVLFIHLLIWFPMFASSMPLYLQQSTSVTIVVGPFISIANFTTVMNGINVTNISIKLIKSDQSITTINATDSGGINNMKHLTNGMYSLVLSVTDTNTIGASTIIIDPSPESAIPIWDNFEIVNATAYSNYVNSDVIHSISDLIRIIQFKNISNNSVFR